MRLTLFRGDALLEVPVTLGRAPDDALALEPIAEPSAAQQAAYRQWLGL